MRDRDPAKGPVARFYLVFFLLLLCAAVLRLHELSLRPLHSDEGVNHFFMSRVLDSGVYKYSHENYHGPLYFYLASPVRLLLGDTVEALRAPSAVFGLLTIASLLLLAPLVRKRVIVLAAALLAVSPSLVFHSRYAIHEPLFLLGTLLLAASSFAWLISFQKRWLYAAGLSAALLVVTKETFIIAVFCIVLALIVSGWGRLREAAHALLLERRHAAGAFLLALAAIAAVYSAGFRWNSGLEELVHGVPQWIGRSGSDVGHHKPFVYYVKDVIYPAEGPLLWALAGTLLLVLLGARRRVLQLPRTADERLLVFFAVWAISAFLVYSAVSYKTPWLIGNMTMPAVLLLAALLDRLWRARTALKTAAPMFAACAVGALLLQTVQYNYQSIRMPGLELSVANSRAYGEGNPYCYAHTVDNLLALADEMRAYAQARPEAKLLVAIEGYWPLPFYLRDVRKQLRYVKSGSLERFAGSYDVILADPRSKWRPDGWTSKVFSIRKNKRVVLYRKGEAGAHAKSPFQRPVFSLPS